MSRTTAARRLRAARVRARPRLGLVVLGAVLAGSGVLLYLLAQPHPADGTSQQRGSYRWSLPADFPTPRVPRDNPMSKAKVELGRRLFYDTRLSGNGTQSCASCHQQERAFTDGLPVPAGSTGEAHPRNAQTLVNVAYQQTLTWANPSLVTLERQMEVPLFGHMPIELGINDRNRSKVLRRLRSDRALRKRFSAAFPGRRDPVSYRSVVQAIASFQRSIISARSKFDRVAAGKTTFTDAEQRGMNLFMGERAECHHCHGTFIFADQATYVGAATERPQFHNNGLFNIGGNGAYPEGNQGVLEVTGRASDMGRFKAPTLRNVELTAPYMHDGSMQTLEAVVAHYAAGGRVIAAGPHAGDGRLSPLKSAELAAIELSERDQADIVAFLRTLTDRAVTRDRRFADPARERRPSRSAAAARHAD